MLECIAGGFVEMQENIEWTGGCAFMRGGFFR